MKRVCHLTSVHSWSDVRIFHKECRSLSKSGFDVHLVACISEAVQVNGITIHSVARMKGGRVVRMLRTAYHVYRTAKALNADIYHFHDPELIPYALLLKWQGKKVIYDVHEDVPRDILSKEWIAPWLRRSLSISFEWFENFAARRFASVVAATPHIAKRFASINAASIDINNYPISEELSRSDATTKERAICYVGGIWSTRGAFEMVRAMEFIDARLIMAGPFQNSFMEAKLKSLPGWAKVDYRGVVDRAGVAQILAESRLGLVLLHPLISYLDSLPIKMFEYMSAGLPVLASDFPYWKELLHNTGAGVCVDPQNPQAIAKVINELLNDPDRTSEMGAAGKRAVSTKFSWENEEIKLINLYNSLN